MIMDRVNASEVFQKSLENVIDTCPHCGTKAHLKLLFQESHVIKEGDVVYYATFRCVPCNKLVLKTFLFRQNRYNKNQDLSVAGWQDKFPGEESVFVEKFRNQVPEEILKDFQEGVISLHYKCPKAAVSMFRRALQAALQERGAVVGEDLSKQIKDAGYLTQDIKDWAHNIRIFGNWGAHPQNDNLKEMSDEIAKETQDFLEEFFNYVYVMPSRVVNARQRNTPQT